VAKPRCVCGCGQKAVHQHHAVYQAASARYGGDEKDERNLVPVAFDCHFAHHSGAKRFRLRDMPDSVFEFAREMAGPGVAYELLGRYYGGEDPRLDALLADA
jgi:hypothetical protein